MKFLNPRIYLTILNIFILLLFFSCALSGQPWMGEPYLKIETPGDSAKLLNFYEIKKAFEAYEKDFSRKLDSKEMRSTENEEESEIPGYAQYKRWEHFMEPRVYPSGDITLPSTNWQEFQKYINSKQPTPAITANWTSLGPFTIQNWQTLQGYGIGRIDFIRIDPTNNNNIWIGSPSGGLWKSTNGGVNWSPITDFLSVIGCADLVIDSSNTNILYLATGCGSPGSAPPFSIGVLKSTNGGASWDTTGLSWNVTMGRSVYKLAIDPSNSNIILAATSIGIYKSIDAGANWTLTQSGSDFTDIKFKPNDSTTVYASSFWGLFYKSINAGSSFINITAGLPIQTNIYRSEIGVCPSDPNVVYLVTVCRCQPSALYGFYRSNDSGDSFVLQADTPNILGILGNYALSITVNPFNSNDVYVGGIRNWHSTNGGINWTPLAGIHSDNHALEFLPGSSTTIFSGNDGGVFKSTNNGTSWINLNNGLAISQMYRLGTSASNPNINFTGLQDNGYYRQDTNNWTPLPGGDGSECIIDYTNSNIVYVSDVYSNMFKSITGGTNFATIATASGSGVNSQGYYFLPFIMHPTDHNTLLVGKTQVYRTIDGGMNWLQVGTIIPGTFPTGITSLSYAASNPNYIYVASGEKLYVSTNGSTFINRTGTLPNEGITYIAVSNTNPNKVWVTYTGYSAGNKVYFSSDAGINWTNYSAGLPNLPINCIVYQNNSNDGVYVGADAGVYFRNDTLSIWEPFFTGLPNVIVNELEIQYSSRKIRAATYGRGLWESDLAIPVANFSVNTTSICLGDSITFTDLSSGSPTSWSWSFPGGTPSTSNLSNPTIKYNLPGVYNVQLTVSNSSGNGFETFSNYITVDSSIPTQPGLISGNNSVCLDSIETFSIAPVLGATSYTWTLPSGWTDTSSTNSITALVDTTSGLISVTANNGCGSSTAQILPVSVNLTPTQPNFISGNNSVCLDSIETFSIAPVSNATSYTWTLPLGWPDTSSTNSITTIVGSTSGLISVTANNSCGSSPMQSLPVSVSHIPTQPAYITGDSIVNTTQSLQYNITPDSIATGYNWTLSGGGIITGGQNTPSITINWTSQGIDTLSVNAINICGTSINQTLIIHVSNPTGIFNSDNKFDIKIYPNLTYDEWEISIKEVLNKDISIEVTNMIGQKIFFYKQRSNSSDISKSITLKNNAHGIYNVKIQIDKMIFNREIVK